jgi:hypothetical protein
MPHLLLQVEYVRLDKELGWREMAVLFAVALPGADGRALHARGQDGKRQDKIINRMSAILVKLHLTGPMEGDAPEYIAALGQLRDQEVRAV